MSTKSYGYLMSLDIHEDFYSPEELVEFLEDIMRGALINVDNLEVSLMGELTNEEVPVND